MKRILLISLLLTSFGMAEEANYSAQEIINVIPKNLQDLGRGYAQDPTNNQIYYEGKLIKAYSPRTFSIINKDNENNYDAEDHYTYYKKGWPLKDKVKITSGPDNSSFDTELNIPIQCFDDINNSEALLNCYQQRVHPNKWPSKPPMDPKTFSILNIMEKAKDKLWDVWVVADQDRVMLITNLLRSQQIFVLDKISDFASFSLIEAHRSNFIMHDDSTDAIFLYFKDKNYVYSNLGVIEGADPNTFEVLEYPYTKDKNHVYYKGEMLKDAVSAEFNLLDYRLYVARDKTKLFYKDKVLDGFDVDTFKIMGSPFPSKRYYDLGSDVAFYPEFSVCPIGLLMDKNNFYYIDMFLLLQPEVPILLSTNGNKGIFTHDRIDGLIPIPFEENHTDIEIVGASSNSCKTRSSIFFKDNNTIFHIHRENTSLFINTMKEIDAESFNFIYYGRINDKNHRYRLNKNYIFEKMPKEYSLE